MKGSAMKAVTVTTAGTKVVGGSRNRVGLILSAPNANRVTLSFSSPAVDMIGIVLYSGTAPIMIDAEHYGDFVAKEIWAISAVADQTIGVVEIFYNGPGK